MSKAGAQQKRATAPSACRTTRGSNVQTCVLTGFDDPRFGRNEWERLLERTGNQSIYLTWPYQRTWWEAFPNGELLLILATRDGEPIALAPFYTEAGMVFFLATDFDSDYLDFIGEVNTPILGSLLATARAHVPNFKGFRFYFVRDRDGTGRRLAEAAGKLDLCCYEEQVMVAPELNLSARPEFAAAILTKKRKSLLERERFFLRHGVVEVHHDTDGYAIIPHLDDFYRQHIARFNESNRSRLAIENVRTFFNRLTRALADTGWLRFTRICWDGRPIAFHYGFCYKGRFFWGLSSFAADVARHSPGQLLLRQLLLAALEEGAHTFDFGTGDHSFKLRFSTNSDLVRTWGLYPN
jgi:CelD/BcsL family acetyltransferase involved in cellulose biosynthesis